MAASMHPATTPLSPTKPLNRTPSKVIKLAASCTTSDLRSPTVKRHLCLASSAAADHSQAARRALSPCPTAVLDLLPQHGFHHVASTSSRMQQAEATTAAPSVPSCLDMPLDLTWTDAMEPKQVVPGSGRIDVICGPMFAGKSTKLLQQVCALHSIPHIWFHDCKVGTCSPLHWC